MRERGKKVGKTRGGGDGKLVGKGGGKREIKRGKFFMIQLKFSFIIVLIKFG